MAFFSNSAARLEFSTLDNIAFIHSQFLKLSALICVDLPFICGCSINQRFMQFKSLDNMGSQKPGFLPNLRVLSTYFD